VEESKKREITGLKTSFPVETDLYITQKTMGQVDEFYQRFYKTTATSHLKMEPVIRILDKTGKEIVSEKLKYG